MKNADVVFDIYCKAIEKDYNNFLEDFLSKEIIEQSSKGFAYIKIFLSAENDNIMQKCRPYLLSKGYTVIMECETLFYSDDNTKNKGAGIPYLSDAFNENAKNYQKVGGYTYKISWYNREKNS